MRNGVPARIALALVALVVLVLVALYSCSKEDSPEPVVTDPPQEETTSAQTPSSNCAQEETVLPDTGGPR